MVATTVEPAQAVSGGTVVDEASFDAEWSFVVGVGLASEGGPRCTGSLVDSVTVITAAHCVTPVAPDTVWFGSNDIDSAQQRAIASFEANPLYVDGNVGTGGDSAILLLDDPITDVTPIRVVTGAEDATLPSPASVRFAGFGLIESGPTSELHQATTTATKGQGVWSVSGLPNGCPGDSGGPLVTLLPSGEPVLVGAASSASNPCGNYGSWTNLGVDSFIQNHVHPTPSEWALEYTVAPASEATPLTIEFDLTGSGYSDGRPTTYVVLPDVEADPQPMVTSEERVLTFTYPEPGTYRAYVGFTDGASSHGETVSVEVALAAPTAVLTYTATPTSGEAPLTVEFDLTGSGMSDGSPAVYAVDPVWTPEQTDFDGELRDAPFSTTFTYTEPGTYQALVAISNSAGDASEFATLTITVTEPAPTLPPFEPPVDNDEANKAKAGRMIPFRFTVTDNGEPVTGLSEVTTTSTAHPCPTQLDGDAVESYVSGESGTLIDLGGGRYQYNWKTPKSWAGSCRTLTLDVGDGPRSADFEFTR